MGSINNKLILELELNDNNFKFFSSIEEAQNVANKELSKINKLILDNEEIIKRLTPECDKVDYILATCSGAICEIIDIFLVAKPGQAQFQNITDKWFENRTKDFAKLCGWNNDNSTIESAIRYLEKKFKIPYDQTGMGLSGALYIDLTPKNHHFKSLGHNPSLLGLFFSILNQFNNTSSFISNGELITHSPNNNFELQGNDIPSKIFCGFINWFGHIISDMSGSSSSSGRGMGIPSPLWSWTNDIIAIKSSLKIPVSDFDKNINELALEIYKEGYDARFQATQAIPVFINELIVRFFYSIRRLIQYFKNNTFNNFSFSELWKNCEPFSNATVKRMLTVAHGTFCLIDVSDAIAQGIIYGGGYFNVSEFIMRLNIPGIGRFSISLYGELDRKFKKIANKNEDKYLKMKEVVVKDYIDALNELAEIYDDITLRNLVEDFKSSNIYIKAFEKSVLLAAKRNVDKDKILRNKANIDNYFTGGNS